MTQINNVSNSNNRSDRAILTKTSRHGNIRSTREQMVYLAIFILFVVVSIIVDNRHSVQANDTAAMPIGSWTLENGEPFDINDLPLGDHTASIDIGGSYDIGSSLCMKSIDTTFTVYADDNIIYDYHPVIPHRFGKSYGMYVHTIAIPENTEKLSIKVEPIFPDTHAGFRDVAIQDGGAYMISLFKENLFSFCQSAGFMIIGIVFLVIGLSSAILMRSTGVDFISFGTTCLMVGFVGFNDTLFLQVLTGHPELIRVLTYVCLIFLPFPILSFFASALGNRWSTFVSCILLFCLLNFVTQLVLTYKGVTDYYHLVHLSHFVIMLDMAASVWLIFDSLRKKSVNSELLRSAICGLLFCIIGVTIDLVRYRFFETYGSSRFTNIGLLLFTVLLCRYLFHEQTRVLEQKSSESIKLFGEIAKTFAKVIDMKDKYTRGHSFRVAKFTAMLAEELGYDEETVEKYYYIALLHDVGKIAVPREVLNKPGKLTDEEYSVIKSHTTKGYELLKDITVIPDLAVGAQSHHERPDGKGYPSGLSGNDIPRPAQIIAVADCFDAMYSNRPYRKRMEFEKAVSIIKEVSGTQLTADVVDAFVRLVEKGRLHAYNETAQNQFDF